MWPDLTDPYISLKSLNPQLGFRALFPPNWFYLDISKAQREGRPIRAFFVEENNLIVPFFPQFDLFSDARKGGANKVCYTSSDCQSGHFKKGRSYFP